MNAERTIKANDPCLTHKAGDAEEGILWHFAPISALFSILKHGLFATHAVSVRRILVSPKGNHTDNLELAKSLGQYFGIMEDRIEAYDGSPLAAFGGLSGRTDILKEFEKCVRG